MRMETPLSRVRGLGSARSGAHHWWHERLSSIAAFVLYVWLIVSVLRLPSLERGAVVEWLANPIAAVPMLLLIVVTFVHLKQGLQQVIDDYFHEAGTKLFTLVLLNLFAVGLGALAFFSVLEIAFGGDASKG